MVGEGGGRKTIRMKDMKELERILKACANGRRLAILKFLKRAHRTSVSDIAREIELSFKSTSRHLTILRSADILDREQIGLEVFYWIAEPLKPAAKHILSFL